MNGEKNTVRLRRRNVELRGRLLESLQQTPMALGLGLRATKQPQGRSPPPAGWRHKCGHPHRGRVKDRQQEEHGFDPERDGDVLPEPRTSTAILPASAVIAQRQALLPKAVTDVAWQAQTRLCARYPRLAARKLPTNKVVVAIARDLAGLVWTIARQVSAPTEQQR